ncbi:hypothetical protein BKA61DRAFT_565719 [Leptodontidium sp. MPI-SDFR-AT-0119]|nr:hypothetical protein BKA61DRAFT_565719 [Leptodontidium sp. MPI-SDFR-AT-0119]
MTTTTERAYSQADGDGQQVIPVGFRSRYSEFDWETYPQGKLIHVMVKLTRPSAEVFLFTGEGFWYSNKRFPRVRLSVVRDWPSEEPQFNFDPKVPLCYFIGRDINVETETIMFQGKPYKPNYELRDRDLPYILTPDGYIKRVMWCDVPEHVHLAKRPYKFVQTTSELATGLGDVNADFGDYRPRSFGNIPESLLAFRCTNTVLFPQFRNKKGEERMIETGLTKEGSTFVLVNEEIEAEMDEDKWWVENQNMIQLGRRDGMILPRCARKEQDIIVEEAEDSEELMSGRDGEATVEAVAKKDKTVVIDEGVSMSREASKNLKVTGDDK